MNSTIRDELSALIKQIKCAGESPILRTPRYRRNTERELAERKLNELKRRFFELQQMPQFTGTVSDITRNRRANNRRLGRECAEAHLRALRALARR